ncbi:hypothetical protein SAMN04488589_1832 [Methanolobus vulcani]|jgi:hypothetical protein|uniref:Uncharacterized protein n=1 Tax=Methanolobus vulcani TaxID=38026 RepID=A0A7Z7FCT6_9EURY|nr:hypothetical protein [Methanolobus vulcani]SDF96184.1 hypothetical protein SAMN04488589_1832 [Methanolobus vulcani]
MGIDIRSFVKKQEAALKRYRRLYKILDFLGTAIILYLLFFYFRLDQVFPYISNFEVRAGTSYDILGTSIAFETVALSLIAAFLSLIITLLRHLRDDRTKAIPLIEKKNPELHEKLRTAYDNSNETNLIVADLLNSVSSKIAVIASSELLTKRKLVIGVVLILLSGVATVYVVNNDVRTSLFDQSTLGDLVNEIPGIGNGDATSGNDVFVFNNEGNQDGTSSGTENLTGDTAIIVQDGKEVDLTLPAGSGVGFTEGNTSQESDTNFDQSSPYERSVISSQTYNDKLPQGYESIIKEYFKALAEAN